MLDQFKVLYTYKLAGWGARFTEKSFDSVFFEIERVVNVSVLILQTDKVDGVKQLKYVYTLHWVLHPSLFIRFASSQA